MTAIVSRFALIGRSYPSDVYQDLYRVSLSNRAQRRLRSAREDIAAPGRVFQGSSEPISVPDRLSA